MRFLVASTLATLLLAGQPIRPAAGDERGVVRSPESFPERLKATLKVRRPEDEAFIERVARLVESGELPRKIVDSTSIWASRRRQEYPFPAFERALRLQADRLGVDL